MWSTGNVVARMVLVLLLGAAAIFSSGCTGKAWGKVGRGAATPVVVVRDVVDAPLVSISSVSLMWAKKFDPFQPPQPGVSWNPWSGFGVGIGYGLGWFVFNGVGYTVGGVDYVVCRSLYPNWPDGLTPWKRKDQEWGDLYFPGTRALWGDHPPDHVGQKPPATREPSTPEATSSENSASESSTDAKD